MSNAVNGALNVVRVKICLLANPIDQQNVSLAI